jgi:hypothetical protein
LVGSKRSTEVASLPFNPPFWESVEDLPAPTSGIRAGNCSGIKRRFYTIKSSDVKRSNGL